MQTFAKAGTLVVVVFLVGTGMADDKVKKAQQNQMVRGTIKKVEADKSVLIINQKVKKEFVQRELDIGAGTEIIIESGKDKKKTLGKEGLELLTGKEGAAVVVKCDKDVKVLSVTVKIKK